MTNYLAATAAAVAMRQACERQIAKGRSITSISLDAIVTRAVRDAAVSLPCPDDAFERMAQAVSMQIQCSTGEAFEEVLRMVNPSRPLSYELARNGGWYVNGVRYPDGACACVSGNHPDRQWRIVCNRQRGSLNAPGDKTYRTRDEAARAEQALTIEAWVAAGRASA